MSLPCTLARFTRHLSLNQGLRYILNARPGYDFPPMCDVVVVGGGIVGSATARQLKIDYPDLRICMVEKESALAKHQSGNNGGVIHSGIFYKPGSLKAKLCIEGNELVYKFLAENKIPHKKVGKLVVAVDQQEVSRLEELCRAAVKNGCKDIKMIDQTQIQEIQPHCRGLKAIWSPNTGVVDWAEVSNAFVTDFEKRGGTVYVNYDVKSITPSTHPRFPISVRSDWKCAQIYTKFVVTCGGLHSDKLAQMSGCSPSPKVLPFRGDYSLLKPEKKSLIKTNIYPVPDPHSPFHGGHLTPRVNGDVWIGPNIRLASSFMELPELLQHKGMRKLSNKHGLRKLYSGTSTGDQMQHLQRIMPDLKKSDAKRGPSNEVAEAVDDNGNIVDDFVFDSGNGPLSKRVLHVRNAPSPGATSSMAIARMISKEIKSRIDL
ncbi:unnamed protein product [Cylicocyclus nassatus]|uniref:L-2-hydroxyglutarate dehydrogenase, mitochondrial n=1 Tax=Cylicocyclus nassatus TaxID=53992 RepID=A0AA36DQB2_CYLNA|nr:unnamed protein product [Cylicocyclus nassatus]